MRPNRGHLIHTGYLAHRNSNSEAREEEADTRNLEERIIDTKRKVPNKA